MRQLTFTILLTLISISSFGQKTICGPDTIRLELNGYEEGVIQWEESYDSINWKIIPGATDTVYEAYVNENKYFRAQLTSPDCPPEYSEVFTVNMPIHADAGMDRKTPTDELRLHGNEPAGTNGSWTLLSGTSGTLANPDTSWSMFYGTTGNTYELEWTLTGACGTSRDTVVISFVENTYSNNIIYIDSTDEVLSDSAEIANGTLRVIFSDSAVTPNDSSSLIFLTPLGLNLKTDSVVAQGDTFEIAVNQGTVEDILQEGVINFAPSDYQNSSVQRKPPQMPTRKKLLDGQYKNGEVLYSDIETPGPFELQGIRQKSTDDFALELAINTTVYSDPNMGLTLDGSIELVPNMVALVETKGFKVDTMILGLDNASLTTQLETKADLHASINLANIEKQYFLYRKDILFMAGTVPVWVTADVYLNTVFTANAYGEIEATFTITTERSFDSYIYYEKSTESFKKHEELGPPQRTVTTNIDGQDSLSQEFKAGPGFALSLYRVLTGNVNLYALKQNFDACINLNPDWRADFNLSTELELGASGEVLGFNIFNVTKAFNFGWFHEQFPENITITQGNFQHGTGGEMLSTPLGVQVRSTRGIPLPFVKVYFEPVHGSVSENSKHTNENGIAKTDWTLQIGVDTQKIEAYIQDCDQDTLAGPDTFTAYAKTYCDTTPTAVVDVTNPTTGKTWMDRNLGASRAATSSTDAQAYGHLYQWGRGPDGHQCRNSGTTSTLSSTDQPGHGDFILAPNEPNDWRSPQNDNLWQGVNGVNNPCPSGYRLPTLAEWEAERQSWSSDDASGAIASPLKLPLAGLRDGGDGSIFNVGTRGYYWSSTADSIYSRSIFFASWGFGGGTALRAWGYTVRCIKD